MPASIGMNFDTVRSLSTQQNTIPVLADSPGNTCHIEPVPIDRSRVLFESQLGLAVGGSRCGNLDVPLSGPTTTGKAFWDDRNSNCVHGLMK